MPPLGIPCEWTESQWPPLEVDQAALIIGAYPSYEVLSKLIEVNAASAFVGSFLSGLHQGTDLFAAGVEKGLRILHEAHAIP